MQYFFKNIDHQTIPRTYVPHDKILTCSQEIEKLICQNGSQNTPNYLAAERNMIWKKFLITFLIV